MEAIPPEPSRLVAPEHEVSNRIKPTIRERLQGTAGRRAFIVVLLVLGILFPLIDGNEGDIDAAANALAFAILALGLNIVVGFAGLLDLGYAAFFAIGAYTYGVFSSYQVQPEWWGFWEPFQWLGLVQHVHPASGPDTVHFTVSFWLMLPVSAVITAFFGVLFGAPTLRLKGDYLAIVTLGFGEIVPIVARNTPYLTNGAMGLNGVASPSFFGYAFGVKSTPFFYLGLALAALLIFVSLRLKDSRIGRAWLAIREDELAASMMGVSLVKTKLSAYAVGAVFGGLGGVCYATLVGSVFPNFSFNFSITILLMVVLGGMGNVWGVIIGALLIAWINYTGLAQFGNWFNGQFNTNVNFTSWNFLIFGVILVLMMLFRREGLLPESRTRLIMREPARTELEAVGSDIEAAEAEEFAVSGVSEEELVAAEPAPRDGDSS